MNDAALMIAVTEAGHAIKGKSFPTLEAKLEAAMEATKDHWMLTDEDGRFRAAIGAVLCDCTPDEKERIESEMLALRTLSAMFSGIPVDLAGMKAPENPLKLMDLWRKVTKKD